MTYTVTLNAIRANGPCREGWEKLLHHLGKTKADDEPVALLTILETNGLADALWCLCALPKEHENSVRLLVCDLVEPALKYTDDERAHNAVAVSRRFAKGEATKAELRDAAAAARDAAWAAAWAAAEDVSGDAAETAVESAEWAAVRAAAGVSARAARAARVGARAEQERIFRAWLGEGR